MASSRAGHTLFRGNDRSVRGTNGKERNETKGTIKKGGTRQALVGRILHYFLLL